MTGHDFADRYGPWALVLGAGAGLGESYARQLARRGLDLVLVDRDADALEALAGGLRSSVACRRLDVDLGLPDAASTLVDAVADLDVGLLVANAAASHVGFFREQPLASIEAQLQVNLATPVALLHRLLPRLTERDRSGVILMSSLSSRRGAPLVATYAASKAYLAILAESLWDELADDGIDVLGVLPGSTRTPGWLSSLPQSGLGTATLMVPDDVVAEALDALGSGQPTLVAGSSNRDSEAMLESMPRADAVRIVGQVMRDMYPDERDIDISL
ncbi:SDR family NAD(P)-dependent oxidoreductase [Actinospongicola halichondriae]|uniref:SDR family NAD(P)-dependent oxidoreductase n=1 Tax=Actinospongicola halichondriae TaxID=3236844 RepID=UPI003D405760